MCTKDFIIAKMKELQQANVIVKDEEGITNKLFHLIENGVDTLQMISDFDDTLTKYTVDGEKTMNSYSIFTTTKTLSKSCLDKGNALLSRMEKLYPTDFMLEHQIKLNQMLATLMANNIGEKVTLSDVHEAADLIELPLKNGCKEMFSLLSELGVPLTIVSAGSGDVIKHKIEGLEVNIVSNFYKFEDGHISDIKEPIVSSHNKDIIPLPVYETRHNIMLLGDLISDSKMANGISNIKVLLKIGFFYGNDNEKLQQYLDNYDVILFNDDTMNTVVDLLKLIAGLK